MKIITADDLSLRSIFYAYPLLAVNGCDSDVEVIIAKVVLELGGGIE